MKKTFIETSHIYIYLLIDEYMYTSKYKYRDGG